MLRKQVKSGQVPPKTLTFLTLAGYHASEQDFQLDKQSETALKPTVVLLPRVVHSELEQRAKKPWKIVLTFLTFEKVSFNVTVSQAMKM